MSDSAMDPALTPGTESLPNFGFQLSPLSTGQILDRAFTLYRSRFWLFAGLAVFPAAVSLLFGLAQLIFLLATHTPLSPPPGQEFSTPRIISTLITIAGLLPKLCVYGISIAATTWCIAKIYLGEQATMKTSFDFAFRKWFRYVLLVLAQSWFALWLPATVFAVSVAAMAGLPGHNLIGNPAFLVVIILETVVLAVWSVLRTLHVSLSIPACVVEELPIRASIRRSRALLVSRKFRIFLLFLFVVALEMVFSAVIFPITFLAMKSGPAGLFVVQLVSLVIAFLYGVLVSPIAAIGLCLFYFDERVRREGFDIEFLMKRSLDAETSATEATPVQP